MIDLISVKVGREGVGKEKARRRLSAKAEKAENEKHPLIYCDSLNFRK